LKPLLKNEKKKTHGERPKQNTTKFIFINRAGMGEVSILSIPDLNLFFTFTTIKYDGVSPNITLFH
jgi:hypothetical protein